MSDPGIVYILTNKAMPDFVKIGRTNNLQQRMRRLSSSSVPFEFQCYYACKVKDASFVESQIHAAFMDYRVTMNREFFEIFPDRVVSVLKLVELEDFTPSSTISIDSEETELDSNQSLRRRNFDFSSVEIPIDSELEFSRRINNEKPKAWVKENNKILFNGNITSLSDAARTLLGYSQVAGTDYWMYQNEILSQRRKRFEKKLQESDKEKLT
ncbi:MAG TPA: GIY-YIG nuclease family protein [Leptospiraceae bacterium]|nr:GIY-YIG nuclease family protein [Leptospiraceae bacterium]